MELLKDYDFNILYHLGKANVVKNALSRKSTGSVALLNQGLPHLGYMSDSNMFLAHLRAKSSFFDRICMS